MADATHHPSIGGSANRLALLSTLGLLGAASRPRASSACSARGTFHGASSHGRTMRPSAFPAYSTRRFHRGGERRFTRRGSAGLHLRRLGPPGPVPARADVRGTVDAPPHGRHPLAHFPLRLPDPPGRLGARPRDARRGQERRRCRPRVVRAQSRARAVRPRAPRGLGRHLRGRARSSTTSRASPRPAPPR